MPFLFFCYIIKPFDQLVFPAVEMMRLGKPGTGYPSSVAPLTCLFSCCAMAFGRQRDLVWMML